MYYTSEGSRILTGAEADLFRAGLAIVAEQLRGDEGDIPFGTRAFDRHTYEQRFWLLRTVGAALLKEQEPEPDLTAPIEATVGVIYDEISTFLEMEINRHTDESPDVELRTLVLNALREVGYTDARTEEDPELSTTMEDVDEWQLLVDCLSSRILWDNDYQNGDLLDSAPEAAEHVKSTMGIGYDFYTFVPPDPTAKELNVILREIEQIAGWRLI